MEKKIAEGGGGYVFLARITNEQLERQAGCKWAVAKLSKYSKTDSFHRTLFLQEITTTHVLNGKSPHFARMIGFDGENMMMLMHHYRMGSLERLFYSPSTDPDKTYSYAQSTAKSQTVGSTNPSAIQTVEDVVSAENALICELKYSKKFVMQTLLDFGKALQVLHETGFAHRDLKPENILIDKVEGQHRAYLTDFGLTYLNQESPMLSRLKFDRKRVEGLTPVYAAPEAILYWELPFQDKEEHPVPLSELQQSDIYSVGCIIYALLCRHAPWR